MWKRLRAYIARTDALLAAGAGAGGWEPLRREHLVQISFFQHERAVHLAVTLAVALLAALCAAGALALEHAGLCLLLFLLLGLLVPYLVHYYHLENGVQRLYAQYDEMRARCGPGQ